MKNRPLFIIFDNFRNQIYSRGKQRRITYDANKILHHIREVNLTPEELEALRKKEERKDKLHQAYLRRKASGAQKRYENKIKAKKKAEIDAKKAALRAEDMAKGVFIPVSQLPKQEPQKALAQTRAAV